MTIVPVEKVPGYYVRELVVGEMLPLMDMDDRARGLRMVELATCDAHGHRMMVDGEGLQLPWSKFLPLLQAINLVNGMGEEDVEAAEGN